MNARVPSRQSTGLTQSICPATTARGPGGKADPAAAPLPRAGGRGVGRGQSREAQDGSRGTRARGLLLYRPPAEKPPPFPFLVSNGQALLRSVSDRERRGCRGGESLFLMPPPSTSGSQRSPRRRGPSPGLQKVCWCDTATPWSFARTVSFSFTDLHTCMHEDL